MNPLTKRKSMIACKQCGREVAFSAGKGWQHLEPADHDAAPSSKLTTREPDPALDELGRRVDTLRTMTEARAIDVIQAYAIRHEYINLFTACFSAHYYHVPGVPWQTVKAHDTTRNRCHCFTCKTRCQVCQARSR